MANEGTAKLAARSRELAAQGKRLGGRQKGTPNKSTALLKDAILMAAEDAHEEGLVGYLRVQAVANPGPFLTLLGKVLPTQVTGDPDNPVVHEVRRAIVRAQPPHC